jgi:hypothetical protein
MKLSFCRNKNAASYPYFAILYLITGQILRLFSRSIFNCVYLISEQRFLVSGPFTATNGKGGTGVLVGGTTLVGVLVGVPVVVGLEV